MLKIPAVWLKRIVGRSDRSSGRLLALALLIGALFLRLIDPAPVELLRLKTFDFYGRIQPREITSNAVSIVDIDERSLRELGQWPWPRTIVADLVSRLTAMGAVVIGFDVLFIEPDRLSASAIVDTLPGLDMETRGRMRDLPSNDSVFSAAIASSRVVLAQSVLPRAVEGAEKTFGQTTSLAVRGPDPLPWIHQFEGLLRPLTILDQAAAGRGVITIQSELDGIVRRVPMLSAVGNTLHPALSLEMLRVATGNTTVLVQTTEGLGLEGLYVRPSLVKTDNKGLIWVYYRPHNPDLYISAVDVLDGKVDPARVSGRLILVGTSATGLLDIKSSPIDDLLPGVEVHANILDTIISDQQLQRPNEALMIELLATMVGGLLMIVLLPLTGPRTTVIALLIAVSGSISAAWWGFSTHRLLYDPVYPSLTALALFVVLTYAGYTREQARRRVVRNAFSHYMSPALVERLAENPAGLTLGGEMRDMTLLFCDIRGFTAISERFADNPQGLTHLINQFLTPTTDAILSRNGTIDKYMGDCIMSFWNAPLDDPDHARNGCRAALDMLKAVRKVNIEQAEEAAREGQTALPIAVGIGLNTGIVCVGNMGSAQRFDYSVIGDAVNLASRLEGQSKTYSTTIVIGEKTRTCLPGFATLELDLIQVKGKSLPARIFALLGDEEVGQKPSFNVLRTAHEAMLKAYRDQDWNAAEDALRACGEAAAIIAFSPDVCNLQDFYNMYAGRISEFRQTSPGPDWDGVYVATSK